MEIAGFEETGRGLIWFLFVLVKIELEVAVNGRLGVDLIWESLEGVFSLVLSVEVSIGVRD